MKVTTDILHMRPPSSRALGLKHIKFTRDGSEAVVVIQSSEREEAERLKASRRTPAMCHRHADLGSSLENATHLDLKNASIYLKADENPTG